MTYTFDQLEQLNRTRTAIINKIYTCTDGRSYIGIVGGYVVVQYPIQEAGLTKETTLSSVNTNIGDKTEQVANSDTGSFSLISLIKRLLQGITTLNLGTLSTLKDGPQLDAFSKLRVSMDGNRFDNEFIYSKREEDIDEVLVGGATSTFNSNSKDITLAIVNTTNGTSASLYSHYDIPYTAGNSQDITLTGSLNLSGIGGGTPYVFLRSKVTGLVTEEVYDISNIAGTSGIEWAYTQIFNIDFQSLKVGRIRFNMVRNGIPINVYQILNDNKRITGYLQTPTLPIMWRIYNDATYTYTEIGYGDEENAIGFRYRVPKNALATMRCICATVKSEGSDSIFQMQGKHRSADTGIVSKTVTASITPLLSIRQRTTFRGIVNRGISIPNSFNFYGDNPCRVQVLHNCVLTGAVWIPCGNPVLAGSFDIGEWYVISFVGTTNFILIGATSNAIGISFIATGVGVGTGMAVDEHSSMEYDVSATLATAGSLISSEHFATIKNSPSNVYGILGKTLMSLGRKGTPNIISIVAQRITATSSTSFASFNWNEIR